MIRFCMRCLGLESIVDPIELSQLIRNQNRNHCSWLSKIERDLISSRHQFIFFFHFDLD